MSQIIGVRTDRGVLVAADSRVEVRGEVETTLRWQKKLYRLGDGAVLATGGAAVGIEISEKLARHFADAHDMGFDDTEKYVRDFFVTEYKKFTGRGKAWFAANPEAFRLSYFLLAGKDPSGTFNMRFYASEGHDEEHKSLPIGNVITAPRRIGLETRLMALISKGAGMDEIKGAVLAGLELIADKVEAVAGPFDVEVIG